MGIRALKYSVSSLLLVACTSEPVGPLARSDNARETQAASTLRDAFYEPSGSARPRVWWHWMNGNVSKEGITEDLSWMLRIGIGGVQNFEGSLDTPQVIEPRIPYRSPAWREAMRHAVETAQSKGLEFTIAASPGWSQTGGPWVRPEQAMKKLVWSELDVTGGQQLSIRLPDPPNVTGPFADVPSASLDPAAQIPAQYYRDSRVIAFRPPAAAPAGKPVISASQRIDARALTDGDRTTGVTLDMDGADSAWIQFSYETPQTMRSAVITLKTLALGPLHPLMPKASIAASEDGRTFQTIAALPNVGSPQQTLAFPATTARHFRLVLEPGFAPIEFNGLTVPLPPPPTHTVMEVSFRTEARVDRAEDKAGFTNAIGLHDYVTPAADIPALVDPQDVVDLTGYISADGTLQWSAPPGDWRIARFGWSLTGKTVHPASPEGAGLEVDKLNRRHVRAYMDDYLGEYMRALGPGGLGAGGVAFLLTDSFEAGPSNWTDDILEQFESRRGYDPIPYTPVLSGQVVGSASESDRFLWDFRRTLADLIADAHYGEISRALLEHGMGRYSESHEGGRAFVGDGMEVKKGAAVPMGAAWAEGIPQRFMPDLAESASVAHLYGQNIVAAESFTVSSEGSIAGGPPPTMPYGMAPEDLKPLADAMMVNGVNRFVIHTSVHQPDNKPGPGVTLGLFGQWFTRKETWADMADAWVGYLARSSELLQQGRFVADIAWFYGEDDNITAIYHPGLSPVPDGFGFDFMNADAMKSLLDVKDGKLISGNGAEYRILILDTPARRMTLPTLRKLAELVDKGATVVGHKPLETPSLADDTGEFRQLVDSLWSTGLIFPSFEAAADALSLTKDAEFPGAGSLAFVHRKLPEADIYFVANLSDEPAATTARFRVTGKAPQIWRADDRSIREASYAITGNVTEVPLVLAPRDALFVVFENMAVTSSRLVGQPVRRPILEVKGPWTIEFPPAVGEPARIESEALASWTEHTRSEITYFSGTATYTTTFLAPPDMDGSERLILDLGSVKNLARVSLNGQPLGVAWKAPFEVDMTGALSEGQNFLSVEVANLWPNRFIGDKQPGAPSEGVFGTRDTFAADSPLMSSGLLGPVHILAETNPTE